ncbi:MAG: HupE/UreJ family protein [Oleiphilaceae bacterium]|nr:HupE/UreJ family protein [Oleiphilaceae bacterium]
MMLKRPLAAPSLAWLLLLACLVSLPAQAHKPSDSYLQLTVDGASLEGRWDLALRDLHEMLDLDQDGDGRIRWQEVKASESRIFTRLRRSLQVTGDGANCSLSPHQMALSEHSDGLYAAVSLQGECPAAPQSLEVSYDFLFEIDPSHRGLFYLEFGGVHSSIFSPDRNRVEVTGGVAGSGALFVRYLREGAWHIWAGLDHLLFLLCLLLPAVLRREQGHWIPAPSGRRAFWDITKIITAFTLAHALSLTAASLDWLQLPSRWVEATVAGTIVFAAINNLTPLVRERLWMLGFGFGLIHGAGYASVLSGLGLPDSALVLALLGFNLGVEGGQILIAAAFMPLAFLARRQAWYRHGVVVPGSVLAALLGLVWLLSRVFDLRLEGLF